MRLRTASSNRNTLPASTPSAVRTPVVVDDDVGVADASTRRAAMPSAAIASDTSAIRVGPSACHASADHRPGRRERRRRSGRRSTSDPPAWRRRARATRALIGLIALNRWVTPRRPAPDRGVDVRAASASVWPAHTDDAVRDESLDHVERLRQLRGERDHRDAGVAAPVLAPRRAMAAAADAGGWAPARAGFRNGPFEVHAQRARTGLRPDATTRADRVIAVAVVAADDEITVGMNDVTPHWTRKAATSPMRSGCEVRSTPTAPLTCRSTKPGSDRATAGVDVWSRRIDGPLRRRMRSADPRSATSRRPTTIDEHDSAADRQRRHGKSDRAAALAACAARIAPIGPSGDRRIDHPHACCRGRASRGTRTVLGIAGEPLGDRIAQHIAERRDTAAEHDDLRIPRQRQQQHGAAETADDAVHSRRAAGVAGDRGAMQVGGR